MHLHQWKQLWITLIFNNFNPSSLTKKFCLHDTRTKLSTTLFGTVFFVQSVWKLLQNCLILIFNFHSKFFLFLMFLKVFEFSRQKWTKLLIYFRMSAVCLHLFMKYSCLFVFLYFSCLFTFLYFQLFIYIFVFSAVYLHFQLFVYIFVLSTVWSLFSMKFSCLHFWT